MDDVIKRAMKYPETAELVKTLAMGPRKYNPEINITTIITDDECYETQSEMKHTPGPWRILEIIPNSEHARWVKAREGHDVVESQTDNERLFNICSTTKHMENVVGSCEGGHLAEIRMAYGEEGRQQALVNARLMATAPELLEACESIQNFILQFESFMREAPEDKASIIKNLTNIIESAIKKATR